MANLTTAQIKAIAFNAIGRGAETTNYSPYVLSFAGGVSGFSVGYMQWDFSQRLNASQPSELFNRYTAWANASAQQSAFANEAALKALLGMSGSKANEVKNGAQVQSLNSYFNSADGRAYIGELEDKSFNGVLPDTTRDIKKITGLNEFAAQVLAIPFVQGLNEADTRIMLAAALDVFNRSPKTATKELLAKIATNNATLSTFNQAISNLSSTLQDSATKAMTTAGLMNRLQTDAGLLGQAWRSTSDPTLRTGNTTPEARILDAMMRDPQGGNALLDRLASGGAGKPVVLLQTTGAGYSVWRETAVVAIDKNGALIVQNPDGRVQRTGAEGQWNETSGTAQTTPSIRFINHGWRLSLSDGSEIDLGEDAVTTAQINGVDITLDANKQYTFNTDGDLLAVDTVSGESQLLTGTYAGYRVQFQNLASDANGYSLQTVSLTDANDASPNNAHYRLTLDDGQGQRIVRTVSPMIDDTGALAGTSVSETEMHNGIVTRITTRSQSVSTDGYTQRTDTIRYDGGVFASQTITTLSGNAPATTDTFNSRGELVSHSSTVTYEDGSTSTTTIANGQTMRVNTDGDGSVTSRANIQYGADGAHTETVTYADGHTVKLSYDANGTLVSQEAVSTGAQTLAQVLNQTGGTLIDALSLLRALQSGQPLPIVASGLRLANDVSTLSGAASLQLSGAANATAGALSILGLQNALQRGDGLAALSAGAQALSFGATAYANFLGYSSSAEASAAAQAFGADSAVAELGDALPAINIVNSLAHQDYVGAAVAAISIVAPEIGIAYTVFNLIGGLFGGDDSPRVPAAWGSGRYLWNDNGTVTYTAAGETGGQEAVAGTLASLLSALNTLIAQEQAQNPGLALGLIPNRLPSLSYSTAGFHFPDIDPSTGNEKYPNLHYDNFGSPYDAAPGSPESFRSLSEAFIYDALARGAIAPSWEVATAQLQTHAGDPLAGLSEVERAARQNQRAAPVVGSTQTFRPIVLDLGNDGIATTPRATSGVGFDVDDSGYLKQTAWINPNDAFLTLDRNLNDQVDSGSELFSNAQVALNQRGLAGLRWVDADGNGVIDASDPVWTALTLWQDANSNGTADAGETHDLTSQGITALNYAQGTFTQNGQTKQLASPDLEADTEGTQLNVINEGIVIQSSDGQVSLLVTTVDDQTAVQANRDGVTTFEDTETLIASADLLANDSFGGILGRDLSMTGLTNFRHGSGFIDNNGIVHFTPEANYSGSAAGFDYSVLAQNGQTGTARVDVTVQAVNDAPTSSVWLEIRQVYGYTESGSPIYSEYGDETGWHNTPIRYQDSGAGHLTVSDIDDPNGPFTYTLVGVPQMGQVELRADGSFQYHSWESPNHLNSAANTGINDPSQPDAFQIQITDPHGASVVQTVNVTHYGTYTAPGGSGGGGGGGGKPISIDLQNNGFHFTDVDDSDIFFALNNDGWKHRVSWPTADDGLLAFDADNNNVIDQGRELSFTDYLPGAQTDLAGLAAFDSNKDGKLSASDALWNRFGVFQDANQNGVSDPGEFRRLDELGIASIALTSDGQFQIIDGQTVHGLGSVTMSDGSTRQLADVTLRYSNDVQITLPDGTTGVVTRPAYASDTLTGTAGPDLLLGQNGNNTINAGDGDDVIMDDGGQDTIDAGAGNDLIYSGIDNDIVLAGTGDDSVFAGDGDDLILGGDGADALLGEAGQDIVFGGDGNDLISGGEGADVLSGDAGDDLISGEAGSDALFGMAGDDQLSGGDGADRLDGGIGNDSLNGGAGDDVYTYQLGDGHDTLVDSAGTDRIVLGDGILATQTALSYANGQVALDFADGGRLQFAQDAPGQYAIEQIEFADGTIWQDADLLRQLARTPPTLIAPLTNQSARQDQAFVYQVAGAFADADAPLGDTLAYTASLTDGSPLPAWLVFDATTQTFSGTPQSVDVGNLSLRLSATDLAGGRVYSDFSIAVQAPNHAPTVTRVITDQTTNEDSLFSFTLPSDAFTDIDSGDTLSWRISQADGSALPDWLRFDSTTRTLSGTPQHGDVGNLALLVTASDSGGLTASTSFQLAVAATPGLDLTGTTGSEALIGGEGNDTLHLSADKIWSSAYVAYNAGSPGQAGTGEVVAIAGKVGSADFFDGGAGQDTLQGTEGNDAIFLDDDFSPIPGAMRGRVANMETIDGRAGDDIIDLTSARYLYSDVTLKGGEGNDVLWSSAGNDSLDGGIGDDRLNGGAGDDAYVYRLGDGHDTITDRAGMNRLVLGAGILASETAVRYAEGQVTLGFVDGGSVQFAQEAPGVYALGRIEFADGTLWQAADLLRQLARTPPTLVTPLQDQTIGSDQAFSYRVAGVFADADAPLGDTLAYAASLADGSALPDWLSFDAATQTFSGTPQSMDAGALNLRVTATDRAGGQASGDFSVTVEAPVAMPALAASQVMATASAEPMVRAAAPETPLPLNTAIGKTEAQHKRDQAYYAMRDAYDAYYEDYYQKHNCFAQNKQNFPAPAMAPIVSDPQSSFLDAQVQAILAAIPGGAPGLAQSLSRAEHEELFASFGSEAWTKGQGSGGGHNGSGGTGGGWF